MRLISIGYIARAHGIRGEVVLMSEISSPDLLRGEVFLQSGSDAAPRPMKVVSFRTHHGALLVAFSGVTTRTEAELLRRYTVLVPHDKLKGADDDIYLNELPELRILVQEPHGAYELGVITQVDTPAGQELWTITTPQGKEILFPAVPEFVLEINLDEGFARIAPPPGLLELYCT